MGGPAIQAISLTKLLEPLGYETTLLRGSEGEREGSMDDLAERMGVRPERVGGLRRELGPHDLAALAGIARVLRRDRPDVLHTHAAKAGTLGRIATALPGVPRPRVVVHTFHGHVLTGYFPGRRERAFRRIEQALARRSTRLIAVSSEVRDELVTLRVAPPGHIEVVPLGFDLSPFEEAGERRDELRGWLGAPGHRVVTLIARLVPVKRVDRFLRVARLLDDLPDVTFAIVGDGELADELHDSPDALALGDRLRWLGLRRDMAPILAASDVVVQTSDNEGTPVSLIEAAAAGTPAVSTRVGGVSSVVEEGVTGLLAERDDERGLAQAIKSLLEDPSVADRMGRAAAERVRSAFSQERLTRDIDALYKRLLEGT